MVKKRGKNKRNSAKHKSRLSKKLIKSSFQENKVTYSNVKNAVITSKDPELNKELDELITKRYYGQEPVNKEVSVEEKKVDKPRSISQNKAYIPERVYDNKVPTWFYMTSIFAAFLFTMYISIFATIHFGDIIYMNIMIVFLFLSMVLFFVISAVYLISEKKKYHAIVPMLFFFGIVSIMGYAFNAINTSNLVRFSIIFTIIVTATSIYILATRK